MRIEHLNWMRRLNENKNAACQGFAMGKGFELRIGENVRHPRHIMFHSSFFKRNYLFFIFFYIFIPPAITESENNENVRLANTHSASRMICINNLFFIVPFVYVFICSLCSALRLVASRWIFCTMEFSCMSLFCLFHEHYRRWKFIRRAKEAKGS